MQGSAGQQEMDYCAARDHDAADAELSKIYVCVRKAIRRTAADYDEDLKRAEKALLAASVAGSSIATASG